MFVDVVIFFSRWRLCSLHTRNSNPAEKDVKSYLIHCDFSQSKKTYMLSASWMNSF